ITAKFDLTLSVTEGKQGLGVVVKYNTDLFDAATMERFLGHFRTLLEAVVADPQQPVAAAALLSAQEPQQVLARWKQTAAAIPHRCVHELFEEQVEKRPDAVAVTFQGQALTYAELNRRANRLAHSLRGRGVGPETTVALGVERSPEMVIGILGVLKAGGAY